MQVVLFCGGLGTRIRENADSVPKPMIPIGHQPILWHMMSYYSQYGHREFILCLGHKSHVIKDYFLKLQPQDYEDCIVRLGKRDVEIITSHENEWNVSLIDTGIWRSIGQRLWSIRHMITDEYFMVNYSDSLCSLDLNLMAEKFISSGKVACFLAVTPPLTYHFAELDGEGTLRRFKTATELRLRINGGYFIFHKSIFDYMNEVDDLVTGTFNHLLDADKLMAFEFDGFWQSMDTMKDRQILEEMLEGGTLPWRRSHAMHDVAYPRVPSLVAK